jgi:hypothetical protein
MGVNYYGTCKNIPPSTFYRHAGWERKFTWWPRRCMLSNKIIWLQPAYRGTALWARSNKPVIETAWHSSKEHVVWKLKGN